MADKKISALTSATLPLAGTEVLPIVQGSPAATVKVATDDLTVKNIRSNATTGILQIAGPGAGTTRTMTTPNANFTAARTDAAQSFTGDQTLATGNLVQGTAGKGFDFNANTGTGGVTSKLLNWYEEGTFTPAISCDTPGDLAISYGQRAGFYTRIGRLVTVNLFVSTSTFTHSTASGNVRLTGLPFTSANSTQNIAIGSMIFEGITKAGYTQFNANVGQNRDWVQLSAMASATAYSNVSITDLPSGGTPFFYLTVSYIV